MTTGMSELTVQTYSEYNSYKFKGKINFVLVFYKPTSPNESTGFFVIYSVTNIEHLP